VPLPSNFAAGRIAGGAETSDCGDRSVCPPLDGSATLRPKWLMPQAIEDRRGDETISSSRAGTFVAMLP
jgi:hypothetical protein